MINLFLKAKHWQLFLFTFGIPLLFQFIMMGSMIANISTNNEPGPAMMFNYMKFFPVIMVLFMAVFFGWFWSVAIGLQKKVPANVTMKAGLFKVFFFIPLIYILFISSYMGAVMTGALGNHSAPNLAPFALIIPLHLFSMFCIFYCLYFVAKTFKTVELQREVSFSDFAGEFFLIWFYPIGIWIIQPKINRMIMPIL